MLKVDPKTNCVVDRLPTCPDCQQLARLNVVMFNDWHFAGQVYNERIANYQRFKSELAKTRMTLVIIELGAGTTIPTVRNESENLFVDRRWHAHLIRINPSVEHVVIDPSIVKKSHGEALQVNLDALTALTLIDEALRRASSHAPYPSVDELQKPSMCE